MTSTGNTARTNDAAASGLAGLLDELRWRGMIHQTSGGLAERLAKGDPIKGYIGFDPTGTSLHIGSLVPDLRDDPPAARRRLPRCPDRGRDRNDRRPVGPFERKAAPQPRDGRRERRRNAGAAGEVPGLRRTQRRRDRGQLRVAELVLAAPLPAGHRQAADRAVHAGQGFGADPPGAGSLLHRVQLHAPAGRGLPAPLPSGRRGDADGRRRPVGQHHRGSGTHPQGIRDGRRPGTRATVSATRC